MRITLCIIVPLGLVTLLCNATMAILGIGVKVNTLPVIAISVGVGVDYGIYLFERLPSELRSMVLERRTFRAEVLETLYPTATPPPQGAADRPAGAQNPAR